MTIIASKDAAVSAMTLEGIDTWIFDLDNTLYPPETEFMALIDRRITEFVMAQTGLAFEAARALQLRFLNDHGTTLAGMMGQYGIDPYHFLDAVHDVSHDRLSPDPRLRAALKRLPGRRLVFTNGSARHAERVLASLALSDLFDDVFHLEAADLTPKPRPGSYASLIRTHNVTPTTACFFEDNAKNLAPAAALGMVTVLVGPHAFDAPGDFIHYRAPALAPFLAAIPFADESPS
jgi:putative hydrolase of the HAD superfamily